MRIFGNDIAFAWSPFYPCWIPTLILLALILAWLLVKLFKKKIVLDKSALIFVAENETPIREVLQAKFGKQIELLTTTDIFRELLRDKTDAAKKAVWITKESAIHSFETKDLLQWARRRNAIIVTADLNKYAGERVKVYYLTKRFEITEFVREKMPGKVELAQENELIKFMKHTRRKLR